MAKVDYFISYSSKDLRIAEAIVEAIESTGRKCWIAPRDIPYGTPYARAIMEGIDGCDKFMVLITDNSVESEDVLNEVDNAHAIKKVIIPVRLSDKHLPRELNYYLSRTQWLNLDPRNPRLIVTLLGLDRPRTENNPAKEDISQQTTELVSIDSGKNRIERRETEGRPFEDKKSRSAFKTMTKAKIFGWLLIFVSFGWLVYAWLDRHTSDTVVFITLVIAILLIICLCVALVKPSVFKFSRKESWLFMGVPAFLIFGVGAAYTEPNVQSDPNAAGIPTYLGIEARTDNPVSSESITSDGMKLSAGVAAYRKKDYAKAAKIFNELADKNDALGLFFLGKCYYYGLGVKQDYQKAFNSFSEAAQAGLSEAQNSVGVCYLKGHGVDRDIDGAFSWFEKGAKQGNPTALYNLANCYRDGAGVKKDKEKARHLYEEAIDKGSSAAKKALKNL